MKFGMDVSLTMLLRATTTF